MKEFSFIKTSLWSDETFRQMSPEQKLIMLYLLQGTQTNWCGIFKLNVSMMGFFLGLRDDNVHNAFQAFLKQFHSLVRFNEGTSEVAILNWGAMNLANMNEKSLTSAKKDLLLTESESLILDMITESKASRVVEFYTSGLNSIRATRRNLAKSREAAIFQHPPVTDCESAGSGQIEIEREIEKENNPLTPLQGELSDSLVGKDAAQKEDTPPVPPTPPSKRRLPASWDSVLTLRATPKLDGTVSPSESGDIWERRMFVFDAVRRKYPGTKAGLLQEFNTFLKKCWKDKLDIDINLGKMLFAVMYQSKCKQYKDQMEEFFPAWKNLSTWLNGAHWEDEMGGWKSKSDWFVNMCSEESKEEVERLKSILKCK